MVDLGERQLLTQPVALPLVALRVDRLLEQERLVQPIELVLDGLDALLLLDRLVLRFRAALLPGVPVGSAVAVRAVSVVRLQELLILPLQVLFEHDAGNVGVGVFTADTDFLGPVRFEHRRVVCHLADAAQSGVELLPVLVAVALTAIRFQQAQSALGQHHTLVVVADGHGLDQPLLTQMVERIAQALVALE